MFFHEPTPDGRRGAAQQRETWKDFIGAVEAVMGTSRARLGGVCPHASAALGARAGPRSAHRAGTRVADRGASSRRPRTRPERLGGRRVRQRRSQTGPVSPTRSQKQTDPTGGHESIAGPSDSTIGSHTFAPCVPVSAASGRTPSWDVRYAVRHSLAGAGVRRHGRHDHGTGHRTPGHGIHRPQRLIRSSSRSTACRTAHAPGLAELGY